MRCYSLNRANRAFKCFEDCKVGIKKEAVKMEIGFLPL